MNDKSKILKRIILSIPWICLIVAGSRLFIPRFPLSGVRSFSTDFHTHSFWIDRFLPDERTTSTESAAGQRIINDPVYLSARMPGIYDTVEIALEFRPTNQPQVAIGLMRDMNTYSIEIHHEPPERLDDGWTRLHTSFVIRPTGDYLKLVLSAPGIQARSGFVDVRRVHLTYRRPPLSVKEFLIDMRHELAAAWRRLKARWI